AVGEPHLAVVRERLQVDVEDLREPHQQMRRQRTLIVLDEIEIRRRDLQLFGELDLRELLAAAKPAHFGAEFGLWHGSGSSVARSRGCEGGWEPRDRATERPRNRVTDLHRFTHLQLHIYGHSQRN